MMGQEEIGSGRGSQSSSGSIGLTSEKQNESQRTFLKFAFVVVVVLLFGAFVRVYQRTNLELPVMFVM